MAHQYRQGDVFLVPVNGIEMDKLKPVKRDNGKTILAYGEVTGHHHRFESSAVEMFAEGEGKDAQRFLHVEQSATLTHEEHGPIEVEPGDYEVIIQREYTPQAVRNVLD